MDERLPHAQPVRDKKFAQCVLPEVEMLLRVATTLTARPGHAEELVRDTLLPRTGCATSMTVSGRGPGCWP